MAGLRGKKKSEAKEVEAVETVAVAETVEETVEAPVTVEETVEVKEVEVQAVQVEAPKEVKQPQVRVKPNKDLRTYIGDQWYNFKAGVQTTVPQQVKEILAKSGMLDAL